MNKATVVGIIASIIIVIGGGVGLIVKKNSDTKKANDHALMVAKEAETQAMKTKEETAMKQKQEDAMIKKNAPSTATDAAMMHKGSGFITLADYKLDTSKYADSKKVYFFHASWCPVCQSIQKEIEANPSKIPSDTVLIKVDYDSNTALRQLYGVTYQYTFVQFDAGGNKLAKWSASTYDQALAGVI
jgi:thiol-disulfide isomerase/thioredoxin